MKKQTLEMNGNKKQNGKHIYVVPLLLMSNLALVSYCIYTGAEGVVKNICLLATEHAMAVGVALCALCAFALICMYTRNSAPKWMPKGVCASGLSLALAMAMIIYGIGGSVWYALAPVCIGGLLVMCMNGGKTPACPFPGLGFLWMPFIILLAAPTVCLVCVEVLALGVLAGLLSVISGLLGWLLGGRSMKARRIPSRA